MRKFLSLFVLCLCATACIYPYTPEGIEDSPNGVLSVDASINIGATSYVRLGMLSPLWGYKESDDISVKVPALTEARVWVEDDAGGIYTGTLTGSYYSYSFLSSYSPIFSLPTENAPEGRRYRLCIEALNATYTSDWNELADPPVIGEILFTPDERMVNVTVDVDGGTGATGYLLLTYDETWEFHVDYAPRFTVTEGPGRSLTIQEIGADFSRYWCWKTYSNQTNSLVDYTAMSTSGVSSWPLFKFLRTDNRNHKRYCVNVQAKTLSKETFRFLKNLEEIYNEGDNLFTPTPGEIASNIHCESDPERQVLGYALFSQAASKRAWLDNRYLLPSSPAKLQYILPDSYMYYYSSGFLPLEENLEPKEGEGPYGWGNRLCYDCVYAGGTIEKPSYWDEME